MEPGGSPWESPPVAVTHVMRRSWVAVMEIMPIDQGLRRGIRGAFYRAFEEKARGSSRRRSGGFDRAFYGEKVGGFDRAFYGEKAGGFEEKAGGTKRRLHPLGEYIITLYTNGKLRTRVTVTLVVTCAFNFSYLNFIEGHTPKGVGLCVADSHTGNHREDDFTPPETFKGFLSAFEM
ncbi:hypothetical protein Tco_0080366 [Tanacetum coccineum]